MYLALSYITALFALSGLYAGDGAPLPKGFNHLLP